MQALVDRVHAEFPPELTTVLIAGLRRLIDYQDAEYAEHYLDRLAPLCAGDSATRRYRLGDALARGLALWMSFEDTIRVADLKTRGDRLGRIHRDVRSGPAEIVQVTEFLKPRVEEICATLPAGLGSRIERSPFLLRALGRLTGDRRISTSTLSGFLLLRAVAGLARWRRRSLRFRREQERIETWLADVRAALPRNYELAVEIAACQQLVRGYGDTHARGCRRFEQLMAALQPVAALPDAAERLRRWREAALADEDGLALDRELASAAPPA